MAEADRLGTTQYPAPNGDTITYTYDKAGRTTGVLVEDDSLEQLSEVTCEYDELGRLREEVQELGNGIGKTLWYEYNRVGNRRCADYPGPLSLTYQYDDLHRLKKIVDDDFPDDPVGAYTYNAAGELTRLELKNGTCTNYAYDKVSRLKTLVNRTVGGPTISSYHYQRNKVGCPTRVTYHDGRYRFYDYDGNASRC